MTIFSVLRLALLAGLVSRAGLAATPTFDQCLANLRKGPDTFVAYMCLGTPGLPDRAAEVMAVLGDVLRRKPDEPHARVYVAVMRLYRGEDVDFREFTEPLAIFEKRHAVLDLFLARMALAERSCIRGQQVRATCGAVEPIIRSSDELARATGDPSLRRFAAIARMRWSIQMLGFTEARRAEKELDAIGGEPPEWLGVLETTSRVRFARETGDNARARDLYASLAAKTPPDSATHAAALAGVAVMTARMALEGLADRNESERLLRESLDRQKRLEILGYNNAEIGTAGTRYHLALLLGRTAETEGLLDADSLLAIELSLHGDERERQQALQLAQDLTEHEDTSISEFAMMRSHVELAIGSADKGIHWGDLAIERLERRRQGESDEELRMKGDASHAIYYQLYISDLLDRDLTNPRHLEKAWQVSEKLRARVLLETLLRRANARGERGEPPNLAEIQGALRPDEALVSFLVWAPRLSGPMPFVRGHSWALVLTQHGLKAVQFAPGVVLEPAVRAFSGLEATRVETLGPGARRLYDEVLRPVLDVLPKEVTSLTIVPDGPLHSLAFDALSETGHTPYIADRYAISIAPSASVWFRLRRGSPAEPGPALAFANTPEGPAVAVAETRGEIAPGQLGALLHAREEAQEAVQAFPAGSRLLAGADATPDHLSASELERASLVHFAAHGVANSREPDQSFLLLAPAAGGSGMLRVADVQRFDWSGKTVVLSACETSVGAFRVGEGVLSLARGFFAGGASAVIGTLSRVRDDDQRALFHAFYSELRQGVSVGEAMAAAKRSLIRAGAPPAAWANVIVMGDSTVRPRAPDRHRGLLAGLSITGAAMVALTIGLGVRRRRRNRPGRPAGGATSA
jgi:CHAT domain-containing protein